MTLVTSAKRDDHALALLKELGMPFKTTEDKRPAPRIPGTATKSSANKAQV